MVEMRKPIKAIYFLWLAFIVAVPPVMAAEKNAAPTEPLATAPCDLPDINRPARCGVLEVPENPDKPAGRKIGIHVAIVPASSDSPKPDPIVVLAGGPGESAIGDASYYVGRLSPLLADRDLVLVDQRGAGQSGGLQCGIFPPDLAAETLKDVFPPKAIGQCRQELEKKADLTRYTFPYFARDLEAVRRAAGYGPVNLFAGSYGTRAAQVFIRQYPKSVRTAFLGSPVPLDVATPITFARTAQAAFNTLFSECEADEECHAAFSHLRDDFAYMFERLDFYLVRVSIEGRTEPALLTRGRVIEWMRSKLYRPESSADLPWNIHQAALENWSPIVTALLERAGKGDADLSTGVFFSITCNEDIPFIAETEVEKQTADTYLGDYRLREQQTICRNWPKSAVLQGYRSPVKSDVPTLIVTGGRDGGTPRWFTDHVASGFSRSVLLVAQGQGHTEWSDCIAEHYGKLLETVSAEGLGGSCPAVPRPKFKTQ
jgi:pimeloyl-ACP methyl ester carboxylesterase